MLGSNAFFRHPVIAFTITVVLAVIAALSLLSMDHAASAADTLLTDACILNSVL
jgi:hypothetical protein